MKWKRLIRYSLTLVVCLVILAVGVTAVNTVVSNMLNSNLADQLTEITQRRAEVIQQRTKSDFRDLEGFAAAIAAMGGPNSADAKEFILNERWESQDIRLILSNDKGESYSSDGFTGNISGEDVFADAISGNPGMTALSPDILSKEGEFVTMIAPILADGKTQGTLAIARDIKYYQQMLSFTIYETTENGYIVRPDGSEVIPGSNQESVLDYPEIKADIAAGKNGNYVSDKGIYYSYVPLSVEDWYLVNQADAGVLAAQKQNVWKVAGIVGLLAAVLFLVLVGFLYGADIRKEKLMERMAMFDQLTGLPNWQFLNTRFKTLTQGQGPFVYMLFRIPDFSKMSTAFGYGIAARKLKDISAELTSILSQDEKAIHVSEDYFVLILRGNESKEKIENRINGIFTKLHDIPLTDGSVVYDYQCSYAGGAYLLEKEGEELAEINRRVNSVVDDQRSGKDFSWAWFDKGVNDKVALQESLMPELARALKNDEFIPFFQPTYNVNTGEIVGAEVLARWKHPVHGILLPGLFVPLLEAAGCVLELDLIMLDQACKMIQEWLAQGLYPVCMSINISKLNIHRRDFLERTLSIVDSYDIPRNLISLETTEMAISENSEKVLPLVQSLKDSGFVMSMDNFGQGYSSLNMIRQVPLEMIKLSRSFLLNFQKGERENIILRHVVEMVQQLGAKIVAEGVETIEQEAVIREAGCELVQGFFYSRPVNAEDFANLMFAENEDMIED